jgi:hypothetical protein
MEERREVSSFCNTWEKSSFFSLDVFIHKLWDIYSIANALNLNEE